MYIRRFYGDVPITAVDFSDVSEFLLPGVEWVQQDAREYIKTAPKFDAVIVDLFDTGDFHPPEFVLSKEFATDLGKIANYIVLHTTKPSDISAYSDYYHVRTLSTGTNGEFAPRIHYFMVNEVPIPVR